MLKENRISTGAFAALIAVNIFYLILVIINAIEGIFTFWIIFIFLSLLPIIIQDKRYMIAIIVFLIPLEITKTLIPFFQTVEVTEGVFNSVFDISRLFMMYSFIVWFFKDLGVFTPFIRHRISYITMIYILYYLLSALLISPDVSKGITETVRYVIYFLFFTMVIQSIKKPQDFELIFKAVILIAVLLSVEGIFEYVFNYSLWIDKGRRACATYLDPNIFARLLNIGIVTLVILRFNKIYIIKPQYMDISILLCAVALLFTVSRQGMATLFLTLFILAFFMDKKIRKYMLIILLLFVIVMIPVLTQMMTTRQDTPELYDLGERVGLLIGGGLMFIGSPLLGVGAGGFQAVMIEKYLRFLPWGAAGSTLSHTYVVTVLAELGIVGFIMFCVFLFIFYKQFRFNYSVKDKVLKSYALIIFAGVLIVLIGAQAEGRFFEEPFLWLFLGLNISLEKYIKNGKDLKEDTDHR